MKRTMTITCTLLTATLLLLVPTAAQAEVVDIRVDVGNGSGDASPNWNHILAQGPGTPDLVNHNDGSSSGVGAAVLLFGGGVNGNGAAGMGGDEWPDASCDWDHVNATGDYVYTASSVRLRFYTLVSATDGLDPNETYIVEVLASSDHTADPVGGDYTVNGDYTADSDDFDALVDGHGNNILMTWTGVSTNTVTVNSVDYYVIDLVAQAPSGGYAILNAVQLTIPEPATMGLLGLGFAGMAVLRRRRRA